MSLPTPLWTQMPQAQALLASCVAKPPAATNPTSPFKRHVEMDVRGPKYDETDRRVRALTKLWNDATDLDNAPERGTPEHHAFRDNWSRQYECTVDVAIETALAAAHYTREARKAAA
ncbi:MAG: hypothetical protein V4530_06220 [Pseudomonadota bacterium]